MTNLPIRLRVERSARVPACPHYSVPAAASCSRGLLGAEELIRSFPPVTGYDFSASVQSDAGQAFMSGDWGWTASIAALMVFNTVLGEELLFRGLLLPRLEGAFGRWDRVANGFLFALYHLRMPWVIPSTMVGDIFALSYPSRRYSSALIGIAVHSSQTIVFFVLLLFLVLR